MVGAGFNVPMSPSIGQAPVDKQGKELS